MKERLHTLDLCKGVAMILVTVAHVFDVTGGGELLRNVCYSVELPIFFIASGIQLEYNNTVSKSGKEFILGRLKRIMYPYLTFSVIYLLIQCVYSVKHIFDGAFVLSEIALPLLDTVSLWGLSALWFLPVLFFADVLFYLIVKYCGKAKDIISVVILVIGNVFTKMTEPWFYDLLIHTASFGKYLTVFILRILVAYSFVYIGSLLSKVVEIISKSYKSHYKTILGLVLLAVGSYLACIQENVLDLHFGCTRNPFITYPLALILFFGIYLLLDGHNISFLKWVSDNSMFMLGMQYFVVLIASYALKIFTAVGLNRFLYLKALVIIGIVGIVLFLGATFEERYFPYIIKPTYLKKRKRIS